MSYNLDPTRPIYLQIMEEIKKRTVRGQYKPGTQLPSVRELAKEIGVNPNTIARVYMELEREGFISTRRGQGSFITGESERVEEERKKLADAATKRFVKELMDLELHNGHKGKLLDMVGNKLIYRNREQKNE